MKQWNVDVYDTDGLEGCGNKAGLTPLFMKPKFGMEEFSVVHFAGPVKYGVTEVDKVWRRSPPPPVHAGPKDFL